MIVSTSVRRTSASATTLTHLPTLSVYRLVVASGCVAACGDRVLRHLWDPRPGRDTLHRIILVRSAVNLDTTEPAVRLRLDSFVDLLHGLFDLLLLVPVGLGLLAGVLVGLLLSGLRLLLAGLLGLLLLFGLLRLLG